MFEDKEVEWKDSDDGKIYRVKKMGDVKKE